MKYYMRYVLYLIVIIGYSLCYCGSFDDFFSALRQDDAATVKLLLMRGFDPNTLSPAGEHGLIVAVRESSRNVISVLLEAPKINVEVRTQRDESPLMLAALKGLTDLCRQLIALGADVNKPGWTPLHYAATNGHLKTMELLLDEHAYIDATSPNGTTPLMMAAHYGTAAAVKLLLAAGADPTLKNDQGLTAIDFAQRASRAEAVEMIAATIRSRQPKGTW